MRSNLFASFCRFFSTPPGMRCACNARAYVRLSETLVLASPASSVATSSSSNGGRLQKTTPKTETKTDIKLQERLLRKAWFSPDFFLFTAFSTLRGVRTSIRYVQLLKTQVHQGQASPPRNQRGCGRKVS